MKHFAFLATSALALGLASCDSGSSTSSPTGTSYTDVKAANLTAGDRTFLLKLQASGEAFGAISKSSDRSDDVSQTAIAARRMELGCTSPTITHEDFWELGDSTVPAGTTGAKRIIVDDTTTTYDLTTGADITCDDSRTNFSGRDVFRQAMKEGDLLTTSMAGSAIMKQQGTFDIMDPASFATLKMEMTLNMKGTVRYIDGFTLDLDSAYAHTTIDFADANDDGQNMDAYYHVNFVGTAYSSGMRYNKTTKALEGDIVRGGERIGTMKVFRDDRMEVLDLDGKAIQP